MVPIVFVLQDPELYIGRRQHTIILLIINKRGEIAEGEQSEETPTDTKFD